LTVIPTLATSTVAEANGRSDHGSMPKRLVRFEGAIGSAQHDGPQNRAKSRRNGVLQQCALEVWGSAFKKDLAELKNDTAVMSVPTVGVGNVPRDLPARAIGCISATRRIRSLRCDRKRASGAWNVTPQQVASQKCGETGAPPLWL
jgi:hypothetical protein